ncbi:MAG: hypothetical protein KGL69_02690, partial [Alphaproteobacteria bacterium]|nr:hypothetical protein [Alphaproteobacteria bacterium]
HLAFSDEELLHTIDTVLVPSVREDMLTRWDSVALLFNLERDGRAAMVAELACRMAGALGLDDPHAVAPRRVAELVIERANARARGERAEM